MSSAPRWAGWLACLATLAAPAAAQDSAAVRSARITYLTSASAYLDAGRVDGLREGARVDVVRGGATIAVLKVAFLASQQASCDIVSAAAPLVVGDSVRFVPTAELRDSSLALRRQSPPAQRRSGASRPGLRGRVGVEYFVIDQRDGTGAGLSQPALALRLDGSPGSSALNLAVDVRARRTYTILPDGTAVNEGRNRVYQAALWLQVPGSPARMTVGRQISGNLASVGLFDGVMAELRQPDWNAGVFTGTQPEPLQLGFSSSVLEAGIYTQRHSRPGADTRWSLTLGASGSYQDGHANREFLFAQGTYLSRRLSAFLTQEVDYYRPWKLLPGMRAVSPTSSFATLQFRATGTVTLDAGFDNRRNVRLYRDVVNPETAFDDTYRQGAWAGVWVQPLRRFRVGLDARSSGGGPAGHADSYTFSLGGDRLAGLALGLRTRSTRYVNPQLSGWLNSAALSFEPGTRLRLQLNGGLRAERNPTADPPSTSVSWVGADVDVTVARAWYVMVSATRQRGGLDGYDQIYGGVSVRF